MLKAIRSNGGIRDPGKTYSGSRIRIRNTGQGCIYWKILLTGGGVGISADVIREKKYKKWEDKKTTN
jgi:hypothetical protein